MYIRRTDAWPARPKNEEDILNRPDLVGQWEWCRLIPRLHQILASPDTGHSFPAFRSDMELDEACAYWETANYLLRRLLGWRDIGLGLQWWFTEGKPELDDARLMVLKRVFDADGHLETLAMWGWVHAAYDSGGEQRAPERFAGVEASKAFQEKYPGYGRTLAHDPFHGGSNALHLDHSIHDYTGQDVDAQLLSSDESKRKAVLILDDARGWHAALHNYGSRLPDLGERSWHVDVVVRPIGWLGMFRRSRVTGEWFQGKHSIHVRGWSL